MKRIIDKLNITEKVGYFKKLFWLFLIVIIIANIALFYFVNGVIYFLGLIAGNVILVWLLIPIFIWIGKTYLIDVGIEVADAAKEEVTNLTKEKIIKTIPKDEK